MAVANEKVIRKMMDELKQAIKADNNYNHQVLLKHVSHVKLLCDLILEDDPAEKGNSIKVSEEEMKAMIGENQSKGKQAAFETIDHEEANGNSIFDF